MKKNFNVKQFYKELGRLIYAISMSDGKIRKKEIKAMHEFVAKKLALSEKTSDSSGMNQAFYTDFEFEDYARKGVTVEDAHKSFIAFIDSNIMEIDPELIDKSILLIEEVANSFRKINKKERAMIDTIKSEIKEIADII